MVLVYYRIIPISCDKLNKLFLICPSLTNGCSAPTVATEASLWGSIHIYTSISSLYGLIWDNFNRSTEGENMYWCRLFGFTLNHAYLLYCVKRGYVCTSNRFGAATSIHSNWSENFLISKRTRGSMDNASDYRSEDCRFESCWVWQFICNCWLTSAQSLSIYFRMPQGLVAQWITHLTTDQKIAGSNLAEHDYFLGFPFSEFVRSWTFSLI